MEDRPRFRARIDAVLAAPAEHADRETWGTSPAAVAAQERALAMAGGLVDEEA